MTVCYQEQDGTEYHATPGSTLKTKNNQTVVKLNMKIAAPKLLDLCEDGIWLKQKAEIIQTVEMKFWK